MHPKLITRSDSHVQSVISITLLAEIARDGARRMIIEALQLEGGVKSSTAAALCSAKIFGDINHRGSSHEGKAQKSNSIRIDSSSDSVAFR